MSLFKQIRGCCKRLVEMKILRSINELLIGNFNMNWLHSARTDYLSRQKERVPWFGKTSFLNHSVESTQVICRTNYRENDRHTCCSKLLTLFFSSNSGEDPDYSLSLSQQIYWHIIKTIWVTWSMLTTLQILNGQVRRQCIAYNDQLCLLFR